MYTNARNDMNAKPTLKALMSSFAREGKVEWIGVREEKYQPLLVRDHVTAITGGGLEGDRYSGSSGKRGVTLIQAEHLAVIASTLGIDSVDPQQLRRNIVVSGINLLALKDKRFRLGDALLEYTGLCHPCSRMEQAFGPGGYNAVRGHGGINARVLEGGVIRLADALLLVQDD